MQKRIQSALISVFNKDGLDQIVRLMHDIGIVIYSTGGTQEYLESLQIPVVSVETITSYPSILGGRVKTLHPKVFGGILAIRNNDHLSQLAHFQIPLIDLVIVDLYPFQETLISGASEEEVIEKIDIGGISLIRAGAKNYQDVVVIPSKSQYSKLEEIINNNGLSTLMERKILAEQAFKISAAYDSCIYNFFNTDQTQGVPLRYGENPHQKAWYDGDLNELFEILNGKELSYNNILDIDSAVQIINEFYEGDPCFTILKHNNICGIAIRENKIDAWKDALAGDPVSAFGGVFITNKAIDLALAKEMDKLFYEVCIAPDFEVDALELLCLKKNRILLKLKNFPNYSISKRSALNGTLVQEMDKEGSTKSSIKQVTQKGLSSQQIDDVLFAEICAKHLKSNAITVVKNKQLIGMGCGQTSRIDSCEQALEKALTMGFSTKGAVIASEAFFPFSDCVELASKYDISCIIQPGGSMNDDKSIQKANELGIAMVFSGTRHFKH